MVPVLMTALFWAFSRKAVGKLLAALHAQTAATGDGMTALYANPWNRFPAGRGEFGGMHKRADATEAAGRDLERDSTLDATPKKESPPIPFSRRLLQSAVVLLLTSRLSAHDPGESGGGLDGRRYCRFP